MSFIAKPLGGVIIGYFGDIVGRKKMLALNMFLMAFSSLALGFIPTYEQISLVVFIFVLLMFILQGVAMGGEMPGAWIFIAEHFPSNRYGFGIGVVTAGITGGILLGEIVEIIIDSTFTRQEVLDFAWRIPLILGGILGFIAVYLRRSLEEPPIFKALSTQKKLAKVLPLKTVFKKHLSAFGLTIIMACAMCTTITLTIIMAIHILKNIPSEYVQKSVLLSLLMMGIGCIFWGYCTDKFGIKKTLIVCWGGLIITAFYFYSSLHEDITFYRLIFNYCLMGFFVGSISTTPILSIKAFPAEIRYSGFSSAYNLAYTIFSFFLPVLGYWVLRIEKLLSAYLIGFFAILAIIMGTKLFSYKGKYIIIRRLFYAPFALLFLWWFFLAHVSFCDFSNEKWVYRENEHYIAKIYRPKPINPIGWYFHLIEKDPEYVVLFDKNGHYIGQSSPFFMGSTGVLNIGILPEDNHLEFWTVYSDEYTIPVENKRWWSYLLQHFH